MKRCIMRIGFAPSGLRFQGSDRIVGSVSMGTEAADSNARRREPAVPLLHLQIFRALFAFVRDHVITDLVAFAEVIQAGLFNSRDVHENILAAAVGLNKAISLSRIEPLHSTCRHGRTPCLI